MLFPANVIQRWLWPWTFFYSNMKRSSLFTSAAEEGGFHFGLFVCLSVCLSDNWKSCERIFTKFVGRVGHGPGTKWLNFCDDPDHRPDPGVRRPKSGFTGLSKKYLVDSDQSCIANLHCKNHSAILLCWRSAEVCALWVLLVVAVKRHIYGVLLSRHVLVVAQPDIAISNYTRSSAGHRIRGFFKKKRDALYKSTFYLLTYLLSLTWVDKRQLH